MGLADGLLLGTSVNLNSPQGQYPPKGLVGGTHNFLVFLVTLQIGAGSGGLGVTDPKIVIS